MEKWYIHTAISRVLHKLCKKSDCGLEYVRKPLLCFSGPTMLANFKLVLYHQLLLETILKCVSTWVLIIVRLKGEKHLES